MESLLLSILNKGEILLLVIGDKRLSLYIILFEFEFIISIFESNEGI